MSGFKEIYSKDVHTHNVLHSAPYGRITLENLHGVCLIGVFNQLPTFLPLPFRKWSFVILFLTCFGRYHRCRLTAIGYLPDTFHSLLSVLRNRRGDRALARSVVFLGHRES
jgi:hypothetical protein